MRFLFKHPAMMGLAIQPSSVQLIELKQNKRHEPILSTYYFADITHYQLTENTLFNDSRLQHAIDSILTRALPSTRHIAIHVPHYLVKEDAIILPPKLKTAEIQHEIVARIESTYPTLKRQVHFDYVREIDIRKRHERIHFIFAKKTYITQMTEALESAGLIVDIVDTEQHALMRTWDYLAARLPEMKSLHGLLSISQARVLLLLYKDNQYIRSEEAEWHQDLKQLNQFLNLIAGNHLHSTLHLLLTGDVTCVQRLLSNREAMPAIHLHTLPIVEKSESFNLTGLQQTEIYIAFGLALRSN